MKTKRSFNEQARFGLARCPFIPELVYSWSPLPYLPCRLFLFGFLKAVHDCREKRRSQGHIKCGDEPFPQESPCGQRGVLCVLLDLARVYFSHLMTLRVWCLPLNSCILGPSCSPAPLVRLHLRSVRLCEHSHAYMCAHVTFG